MVKPSSKTGAIEREGNSKLVVMIVVFQIKANGIGFYFICVKTELIGRNYRHSLIMSK